MRQGLWKTIDKEDLNKKNKVAQAKIGTGSKAMVARTFAQRRHSLIQLGSAIVVDNGAADEDADIAQAYLEQQFPDDYPKPAAPPKVVPAGPSPEEIALQERAALVAYSAGVADAAGAYQQELKDKDAAAKEQRELSTMGYEEKFRPVYRNEEAERPPTRPALPDLQLLQLSEDIQIDERDDDDELNSNFDPDAKRALDYLSQQFPKDFP